MYSNLWAVHKFHHRMDAPRQSNSVYKNEEFGESFAYVISKRLSNKPDKIPTVRTPIIVWVVICNFWVDSITNSMFRDGTTQRYFDRCSARYFWYKLPFQITHQVEIVFRLYDVNSNVQGKVSHCVVWDSCQALNKVCYLFSHSFIRIGFVVRVQVLEQFVLINSLFRADSHCMTKKDDIYERECQQHPIVSPQLCGFEWSYYIYICVMAFRALKIPPFKTYN